MDPDTPPVRRLGAMLASAGQRPSVVPADPAVSRLPMTDDADLRATIERVAPLCELLYLVMAADGVCDLRERDMLRGALRTLTNGKLRSATVDELLALFDGRLDDSGREARLSQVAARLSADRADAELALAAAAAVAMADGEVAEEERALLQDVSEWLGLGPRRLSELLGGG